MGKRGPAKRPTRLRILQNDPKLKYEKRTEIEPPADNLDAPDHLQGVSRAKWDEMRAILEPLGLLTEADKDQLAQYCVNYELYLVCLHEVKTNGMVINYTGGSGKNYSQVSPHATNLNKLHQAMLKSAAQFGLTPSARASFDMSDIKVASPLAEFGIPG